LALLKTALEAYMGKLLFIILMVENGFSFLLASLFVIFFFRLYPDRVFTMFPLSCILGMVFGILVYLPIKSLLEKK
jgi:hypothetical protein